MNEVVELLTQIENDFAVPKNIRLRIRNAICILKDCNIDLAIKIDQSLQELDDIANNQNVPSHTRTQIWNIVSLLESNK